MRESTMARIRRAGNDAMDPLNVEENDEGRDLLRTSSAKPDNNTKTTNRKEVATVSSNIKAADSAQVPPSNEYTASKEFEMDDYLERSLRVFGPDDFAVAFFLGLFGIMIISTIGFFYLSWSWITSIICVFSGFIIWRHITIVRGRPHSDRGRRWITKDHPFVPDISTLPASYFLFVLGSGGHTTEMIEMIRRSFRPSPNQHRRYLVSTTDTDSLDRIAKLEALFLRCFDRVSAGTLDAFAVPRARAVHQPLWSAPITCLLTAVAALNALTREPNVRPRARHSAQFKYPHVVVTNGPANGFVVCAVAHVLKLLHLVPHQSRLKLVYVESWARSRSLSLTGRLFLWSGIADLFCVQHEELARMVGGGRATFVGLVGAPPPPGG